eukprot:4494599-Amphidinium_carterae.1
MVWARSVKLGLTTHRCLQADAIRSSFGLWTAAETVCSLRVDPYIVARKHLLPLPCKYAHPLSVTRAMSLIREPLKAFMSRM